MLTSTTTLRLAWVVAGLSMSCATPPPPATPNQTPRPTIDVSPGGEALDPAPAPEPELPSEPGADSVPNAAESAPTDAAEIASDIVSSFVALEAKRAANAEARKERMKDVFGSGGLGRPASR
ncbi:MAG: hypothetical protein AAF928_14650 [Myxococcota bacterium]